MLLWDDDLRVAGTSLYMDSRRSRDLCFVSHAHTDHLGRHRHAIATAPTARLADRRIGFDETTTLGYFQSLRLPGDATIELLPAGHVLGSAMALVTTSAGRLLYTGDFKLRDSLTVERAIPRPADHLVMESTFGKPMFRFPPWQETAERLVELAVDAMRCGRQPVVLGYSLGKAQEIVRILTRAGLVVTEHPAVAAMTSIYRDFNVEMGNTRTYHDGDFFGPRKLDLAERGVLVAPPQFVRSATARLLDHPMTIMMSGWALLPSARFRYRVDYVLPLSDHADFQELLELIEQVQPRQVWTHHGYPEFVDHLRSRGIRAALAKPDPQLQLFD